MNRAVKILRIVMPIVAIVCVVVFPPWNGIFAWLAPLPDTVRQQVDEAVDYDLDGIIVYIDQAGQPSALYAAGWKDRAREVPTDPEALFKIGSISKLYLAVAAVKLVQAGELSLDDTLAERLPGIADRITHADRITVRMLLQHRSGIPNSTDAEGFDWTAPPSGLYASLELIRDQPAEFAPGVEYSYSNTNYLLLGSILDRVLGFSHRR